MRRFIQKLPFYRTIIAGSSQFFTDSSKSILYVSFKENEKAKKGNIAEQHEQQKQIKIKIYSSYNILRL